MNADIDLAVSIFGCEQNPTTLLARAAYEAAQAQVSPWFDVVFDRFYGIDGNWNVGDMTAHQVADVLREEGFDVVGFHRCITSDEYDPWTGTNQFFEVRFQSAVQPDSYVTVQSHGDDVLGWITDLERSGLYFVESVTLI